jgi:hypothetical protein
MTPLRTPHSTLRTEDARLAQLHATLKEAQARFRLREAVQLVPIAVALSVGATILLAIAWRLRDELSLLTLFGVGLLLIAAAVLTIFLYAWFRPRDPMHTARLSDHLLSLDERLATALEASTRLPEHPTPAQLKLRSAQLDDALARAKSISMRRDLPIKLAGRRLAPAGLLIVLLAVIVVAPNPLSTIDRAVQGQIAQEQKKIQRIEEAVKASPRLAQDPALQELLKELSDLSRDLSAGEMKREKALARLSDAENNLQKILDSQARSQRAALDELAKQLAGSGSAVATQIGEALQSGDAQKAADALKKAGADAAKMSPEERRALADALKQARDTLAALDPEMARRLSNAAEALSGSDPRAAQKALEALGQHVAETAQKLATQQQISQALSQLQQSKQNIAQAGQGQPTSQPSNGTAIANGTVINGTAIANGTAVALGQLTPIAGLSTALVGTPITLRSPVTGTPGVGGTPVAIPGQGQGQPGGQQGNVPGQGNTGGQGGSQNWGTGHQEPVYAPPSSLSVTLTPVVIQGQPNPGGEQGTAPINGGTTTGEAQVPYEQVYARYLEQAGTALGSDYIPQGYKDLVRDYFSELEPGR